MAESQFKLVFYFQEAPIPPDPPDPPIYATAYWADLLCVKIESFNLISSYWDEIVCVTTTQDVAPTDLIYWADLVCVKEEEDYVASWWTDLLCVKEDDDPV